MPIPSHLTQRAVELLARVFQDEHDVQFLLVDAGYPLAEIPRLGTSVPLLYWRNVIALVNAGTIATEELAKRKLPNGLASVLQQACLRRPSNQELAALLVLAKAILDEDRDGSESALHPAAPRILVLGAVPENEPALRVNRELKAIRKAIARPDAKVRFEVVDHLSTEPGELLELLERERPTLLHFAGYNAEEGALVLERADGKAFPLQAAAVAGVLDVVNGSGPPIQGVVLNACASETVAHRLREHIAVIVGTLAPIADGAAINFATGFYDGLARQESIAQALKRGRAHVGLTDRNASPVKYRRVGTEPNPAQDAGPRLDPFDPNNIVAWPEQGLDTLYIPAR